MGGEEEEEEKSEQFGKIKLIVVIPKFTGQGSIYYYLKLLERRALITIQASSSPQPTHASRFKSENSGSTMLFQAVLLLSAS